MGSGMLKLSLLGSGRCSQNALDAVQFCFGLTGICARLRQRYSQLIEFDLARQLAIDANDDAVLGLEILHGLVGIAGLLAQLSYSLLQPLAGAASRLELRLKLILDVGFGESIGDLARPFEGRARCTRSARCSCALTG